MDLTRLPAGAKIVPMRAHTQAFAAQALLALLAGLGAAFPSHAAAVLVAPIAVGARLQAALHDRYGIAEGPVLQSAVAESLGRALKAAGATVDDSAALRIEVSIEDAMPTHPTRHQLDLNPSLDPLRSVSRGGARLRAVLRGADGMEMDHVDYDDYAMSLDQVSPSGDAWADARVTIQRFAAQVAKAWRRVSSHG
jgi:hypothetical protein